MDVAVLGVGGGTIRRRLAKTADDRQSAPGGDAAGGEQARGAGAGASGGGAADHGDVIDAEVVEDKK